MLDLGAGGDTLTSGAGDDLITGGAGADTIDGGGGVDTVSFEGSAAGVRLGLNNGNGHDGDAEGDSIVNVENVVGSDHDDQFTGDGEKNAIDGGLGDDTVTGGNKQDTLTGGGGGDTFAYGNTTHSQSGTTLRDLIVDFGQSAGNHDVIDLSDIDAKESNGNSADAFTFIGSAGFDAEGQVRAVQLGADTLIHINTSGNSNADMQILLLELHGQQPDGSRLHAVSPALLRKPGADSMETLGAGLAQR